MSANAEALREAARAWLVDDPDPETRRELERHLADDDLDALVEGFATRLEFGTAGLRGLLGPGPGRMNRKLVRQVTRGVADALLARDPSIREQGVVVGADGRHMSPEFLEDTARVFAGAGMRVHRLRRVAATPVVAWLQRKLGAAAAVMVTASHNPPEYNGYKVYADGAAQIVPPLDAEISAAIDRVREAPLAPDDALIRDIDESLLDDYYGEILGQLRHPGHDGSDLRIIATPLHGVAGIYLRELFPKAGYPGLQLVPEQAEPDGAFPTVRFPNPEEPGAMDLALAMADRTDAHVVLANDPDADRLAVAVPDRDGGWVALSGNEIGCLLAHWLVTEGRVPSDPLLMTTIVSSRMLRAMAEDLGAHYDETLTGFKWIAHRSQELREQRGWHLVLGYEEALGYTVGEIVGDKDGLGAALLFAEMTSVLRERGETVAGRLEELYRRYGLHHGRQHSLVRPGVEGIEEIDRIMRDLRNDPPRAVGGVEVVAHRDWQKGEGGLPLSNVLGFELADGTRILVRPSGTEPKIKFYLEVVLEIAGPAEDLASKRDEADARIDAHLSAILERCGVQNS